MAYAKVNWVNGTTPENAATLGQMDQGIADAHAGLPPPPAGQEGKWLTVSGGAMVWAAAPAGGADLSYDGDWAAGTYQDGDVVVKDGIAYICVGGPTTVAPDVTPWGGAVANRPAGELAIQQFVAPVTCPGSTEATATTVVTAPAVTLDGSTPIVIEFYCPNLECTDQPDAYGWLYDGSASLGSVWGIASTRLVVGKPNGPVVVRRELTPAAGTHTYSFRGSVSSGAGVTFRGGPGGTGAWVPGYIRIVQANPVFIAPAGPTVCTYGLALPSSPADGQEHILVDSLTNPSYQWRFRYNAGSSSAYKWEFIGGAPARSIVTAKETVASGSYVAMTTPGPDLTLPRAGDYIVNISATFFTTATPEAIGNMSFQIGAAAATDENSCGATPGAGGFNHPYGASRQSTLLAVAASTVLSARYKSHRSVDISTRALYATPVRVA